MKLKNVIMLLIVTGFVFVIAGCSSSSKLQSSWNENEITVDGNSSDWINPGFVVKDQNVSLNFKNDDKFLYMCLITNDRGKILRMMRFGFILWFYPRGEDSKIIGIKYPMPASLLGREEREQFNKNIFRPDELAKDMSSLLSQAKEIQIINEDKFPLNQFSADNSEYVKAGLGFSSDRFIYELRVPLLNEDPSGFQIKAVLGEKLKIVFETIEPDFEIQPNRGMGRGRNQSDDGGGRGQGLKGNREKQKFNTTEPFNYEIELSLGKNFE